MAWFLQCSYYYVVLTLIISSDEWRRIEAWSDNKTWVLASYEWVDFNAKKSIMEKLSTWRRNHLLSLQQRWINLVYWGWRRNCKIMGYSNRWLNLGISTQLDCYRCNSFTWWPVHSSIRNRLKPNPSVSLFEYNALWNVRWSHWPCYFCEI